MCMMSLSRGGDKCSFQANRMKSVMRTRHCLTEATVARNLYFLISFHDGSLETTVGPLNVFLQISLMNKLRKQNYRQRKMRERLMMKIDFEGGE